MAVRSSTPAVVAADHRRCGGRNRGSRAVLGAVAAGKLAVVCAGDAWSLSAWQRSGAQLLTDSLVVASMV